MRSKVIFVGREGGGERGRGYTAYHVISKQYKYQGNNQHHGTSILLGEERNGTFGHLVTVSEETIHYNNYVLRSQVCLQL